MDPNDTIAAVASPSGPALRGIVRLSGPRAWAIARDGFRPESDWPPPRYPEMRPGELRIDGLRPPVPAMLALWPAPRTYTGQAIAEIHLVGCPPILDRLLAQCLARGARHAEPGEFTLRGFLSGRIDLTRAEAVLGVIEAANQAQLDAALQQLAGGLSGPILALRDHLLDVVAELEANLDFSEEPDVDAVERAALAAELDESARELAALARRLDERGRPEGHPRVVLVGLPNAGKSRLFNALLGRDRAIVSPQAGTTRDYLTGLCDCDGLTVELVDTAGIEEGRDDVGAEAQEHRVRQADRADLLLDCWPAAWGLHPGEGKGSGDRRTLRVRTRCDEVGAGAASYTGPLILSGPWEGEAPADPCSAARPEPRPPVQIGQHQRVRVSDALSTSAVTGAGLDDLRSAIARALRSGASEGNLPAGTAARCRSSILRAEAALHSASDSLLAGGGDELVAFDVRLAAEELGKVVGAVVTDDILDRIFRRFCIGK
jgi:tRNA modification GTPase